MSIKSIPKKIIYIDWNEQKVLTKEEFEESIQKEVDELMKNTRNLGDFATDNYDFAEIGRALVDVNFCEEILERYKEWCYTYITEDMDGIERFEI